ncbi:MAG: hypothetical protein ABI748_10200 [Dokdonella sp.]
MRFPSKSLRFTISTLASSILALVALNAEALVLDSGPMHLDIPVTTDGLYLNLVTGEDANDGWDFNPYADAEGSLSFYEMGVSSVVAINNDPTAMGEAEVIGPSSTFGTADGLLAAQFRGGGIHVVGVRFLNEERGITNYGYVEIQTTKPTGFPATVLRYAFESSGAAIAVPGDSRIFTDDFEPVVILTDCSASVVQTALNTASAGTTIQLPAKDCDWGSSEVKGNAGIKLVGTGRDATTIRRSALVQGDETFLLEFDCSNGKTVELSGINFIGNDDTIQSVDERDNDKDSGLLLSNGCIDFKVHDTTFSKFSNSGLSINGAPQRGVVYRSDFLSNYKCQPHGAGHCYGYGVVVYGKCSSDAWPPLTLGTRDAVFIEDSFFHDNRHDVASNCGSRYVARHNTLVATDRAGDYGRLDAHGLSDGLTGSRSWEIYRNTLLTGPRSHTSDGIATRGGDGVVFENRLLMIPYEIDLSNEQCVGTYPLPSQTREAYIWNNERETNPNDPGVRVSTACQPYLQPNRDYFEHAPANYVPFAYPHPLR